MLSELATVQHERDTAEKEYHRLLEANKRSKLLYQVFEDPKFREFLSKNRVLKNVNPYSPTYMQAADGAPYPSLDEIRAKFGNVPLSELLPTDKTKGKILTQTERERRDAFLQALAQSPRARLDLQVKLTGSDRAAWTAIQGLSFATRGRELLDIMLGNAERVPISKRPVFGLISLPFSIVGGVSKLIHHIPVLGPMYKLLGQIIKLPIEPLYRFDLEHIVDDKEWRQTAAVTKLTMNPNFGRYMIAELERKSEEAKHRSAEHAREVNHVLAQLAEMKIMVHDEHGNPRPATEEELRHLSHRFGSVPHH